MPKLLSSVKKARDVFQTSSEERPEFSLTEISTCLSTHKSSISRIMATRTAEGFVEKIGRMREIRREVIETTQSIAERFRMSKWGD